MKIDLNFYRILRLAARMDKAPKIRVILRDFKSSIRWNKFMKTLILLLITCTTFAQGPYVGIGATNSGAMYQAGYSGKMNIELSHKMPFLNNTNATITALSVGYHCGVIMPSIGIARHSVKDFTCYDLDPTGEAPIITVVTFKPVISLTADYLCFTGSVNYCGGFYGGIGIKVYFDRL